MPLFMTCNRTTSCAAPFVYNSSPLMAKDKNGDVVEWNPSRMSFFEHLNFSGNLDQDLLWTNILSATISAGYHWIDGSVEK